MLQPSFRTVSKMFFVLPIQPEQVSRQEEYFCTFYILEKIVVDNDLGFDRLRLHIEVYHLYDNIHKEE